MVSQRRAYTLIELLLVLALLATIAALVAPNVISTSYNQRLRESANMLEAVFAKARVEAMRSGQIHVFRCEPGSGRYSLETWVASTPTEGPSQTNTDGTGLAAVGTLDSLYTTAKQETLPDGVVFVRGNANMETRALLAEQQAQGAASNTPLPMPEQAPIMAPDQLEGFELSIPISPFSQPILFYPDGTTSSAGLLLAHQRDKYVLVELRGLTGSVKKSDVLAPTEIVQ